MKKTLIFIMCISFAFILIGCDKVLNKNDKNNQQYIVSEDTEPEYTKNNILNEYVGDINSDGKNDIITLYIDAEVDEDGILMENHSNRWSLCAKDGETGKYYTLYDENIQHGNLHFQVVDFLKKDKAESNILLYKGSSTELKIKSFVFEKDKGFTDNNIYNSSDYSDNGINLRFSTIPQN